MDEYIEREAVYRAFSTDEALNGYEKAYCREITKKIPVADVAPVRHGHWIEKEKYTFGVMCDCSICDNRILDTGHSWNYCPNCGCRMDGGETNATLD